MEMKRLSINGQIFEVRDENAVSYERQTNRTEAEKKQARDNVNAMHKANADEDLDMARHRLENVTELILTSPSYVEDEEVYKTVAISAGATKGGSAFIGLADESGASVRLNGVAYGVDDNDAAAYGQLLDALSYTEKTQNRVTAIDETADDEHYPTAKAVFDYIGKNDGVSGDGYWEIGKNKFNPEKATEGYFVDWSSSVTGKASTLAAHNEWSTSDWIAATPGENWIFNAEIMGSMQNVVIHFTDDNGICVADYFTTQKNKTFVIPLGCTKFRFSVKTEYLMNGTAQMEQGTVATSYEPYTETYISGVDFAGVENYQPLLDKIDEKIVNTKYFDGKKAMFFGDSISDPNYPYHQWIDQMTEATGLTNIGNFAISGSKLCHLSGTPDGDHTAVVSVPNQVQYLLNNAENYETPDLIVVFASTNDNVSDKVGYDEAQFSCNLTACDLTTFSGAMRWIYEKLMGQYPDALVVFVTPLQSADVARPYGTQLQKRNAIIANCDRLALDYVDAFRLSGIYDAFEVDNANGKYLADGLHPNTAGIAKIAKCIKSELIKLSYKL